MQMDKHSDEATCLSEKFATHPDSDSALKIYTGIAYHDETRTRLNMPESWQFMREHHGLKIRLVSGGIIIKLADSKEVLLDF